MEETIKVSKKMHPCLKGGLIVGVVLMVVIGVFLALKGPTLVKAIAKASLERTFAPLGVGQVDIGAIHFGWGRVYLRDIYAKASPSTPNLSIQEIDVSLSLFLKMKAVDVVGATLELKGEDAPSLSRDGWQEKMAHFGTAMTHLKQLDLPVVGMRDCLLIIPSPQGPLKIPVHAVTEKTVMRNQLLTVDWGEYGDNKFHGQFILELGGKEVKIDLHAANIEIKRPSFDVKASEISFWASTDNEDGEGYKVDGFAKLDHLMLAPYGTLKMPLEINLTLNREGSGKQDQWVLDALTVSSQTSGANLIELEGTMKPVHPSAQIVLTSHIPQLSKVWDFTPPLLGRADDKMFVEGQVNLAGEVLWEEGRFKTSELAIGMQGVSVKREDFSMEGLTCQVTFGAFKPFTTKGPQRLTASKASFAGIELKNMLLEGLFDDQGLLQINYFTAEALGGSVKAHRFQRLANKTYPSYQFETDFENIELADILKLTDLSSLSGHAKLAGNASMRYGWEEGLDVLQGELHSVSEAGLIQYKPESGASLAQKEVNMAFQVLNDLNFTLFQVRLAQTPGNPSELQGIVKMLGSNPKILNGYPFEFNIVTTGKLKDLVVNTIQRMTPYKDLTDLKKAIKGTEEAKPAKGAPKIQPAKTAKTMKAVKTKKAPARGMKLIKATKRFKQKNRKLKDG